MPAPGGSLVTSLTDLQLYRMRLQEARYSGVRTIRDSNGEEITYRSQSEIERAIASLDSEIRSLTRTRAGVIYPRTSKGV